MPSVGSKPSLTSTAGTSSGSPTPVMLALAGVQIPMRWNTRLCSAYVKNMEADVDNLPPLKCAPGALCQIATSSFACG